MSTPRKVCSLSDLLDWRERTRQAGRSVVHCHGCFDIVHPGHIAHLQFARSLGDTLVVTISSDANVNKGVARPLIPEDLRAASVAALECVDVVYVNPYPTAIELLDVLRPDVYVKGREYEANHDPRFLAERDAVIRHGGKVTFTSGEIVYSSTALIGAIAEHDSFEDEKLARYRERHDLTAASLSGVIHRMRGRRVLVVGDYILDRYHHCDAAGIASEGPMMTLRPLQEQDFDGGAGVIALHLAGLGAEATLITATADDDESAGAVLRMQSAGVNVQAIAHRKQTVAKSRFLVDHNKLFKVDRGSTAPLDSAAEAETAERIFAAALDADAVIFADFGYGLITGGLLDRVLPTLRKSVPILTADVSGKQSSLLRFREVDLLCPTEREARETLQDFSSGMGAVAWNLMECTGAKQVMLTLGKQGLVSFDHPAGAAVGDRLRSEYLPAMAHRVIDPLGCGDALLATASIALAAGAELPAAAWLGSIAAAIEAGEIGNRPMQSERLLSHVSRLSARTPTRLAS